MVCLDGRVAAKLALASEKKKKHEKNWIVPAQIQREGMERLCAFVQNDNLDSPVHEGSHTGRVGCHRTPLAPP
jgi:hypothetical protein